jgi:hypothetical protein
MALVPRKFSRRYFTLASVITDCDNPACAWPFAKDVALEVCAANG